MIIGIDIDNTITDTAKKAAECLKEFNPSYKDYHDLPIELYNEFMLKYISYITSTCNLKDGVKEAFDYLREKNYQIIIITARSHDYKNDIKEITLNYLKTHELFYDKIIFDKTEKGECAKENHIDIFIDDKESVLDDMNRHKIECIHIGDENSKYKSFTSWCEILEYIKTKEG